mgnify:CR=1 FL=1
MPRQTLLFSFAAALLLAVSTPVAAVEAGIAAKFSEIEIIAIRAYYRDHDDHRSGGKGKANGKGKKGVKSLPPGIAKNLRRGKPLPPGIAKQALPDGLVRLLPPAPRGYERIVLAGKILLVEIATQVIHDVLEDVILD